jgi:hypothetical protein
VTCISTAFLPVLWSVQLVAHRVGWQPTLCATFATCSLAWFVTPMCALQNQQQSVHVGSILSHV